MRKKRTIFNALFSLILSIFGYSSYASEADRPWFETAKKLAEALSPEEMRMILTLDLPGFLETLEKDALQNRTLLNFWGVSRNIDESRLSNGTLTVPAQVIHFLNSILNVEFDENAIFGHAGLTHTYGYLFSNLQTPFGYKRARYVNGEIEAGMGLPQGLISGLPSQGTLLSNLTCLAGSIAFRNEPELLMHLNCEVPEISGYDFKKLRPRRLLESMETSEWILELRTDIIPFPFPNTQGKNSSLLIYSLDFHGRDQLPEPRLITVFPVEKNFEEGIFSPNGLGSEKQIRLKYNAALPVTIPQELMVGTRKIIDETHSDEYSGPEHQTQL